MDSAIRTGWTDSLFDDALATVSEWVGGVAAWLLNGLWTLMDTTTLVDLRTGEFTRVYNLVFGVAVFLMLGFFLLQVIGGMLRREPGALARALTGLAKSVLGSFVVVTLTATLLEITDQVCLGIVHATGTTMEQMGSELALVGTFAVGAGFAPGVGALLALILAGLAAGAALILWFSLLMRKALLLVAVALAPLALAGTSWDATRGWVAKWAQMVVALILSKVVIVVVFLLATSLVSTPVTGDVQAWTQKLTGVVLLLVAGFAPYLAYKAISFMGFDMYHAISIEQEAKGALNRPMPMAAGSAAAGSFAGRKVPTVLGADAGPGASGGRIASGGGTGGLAAGAGGSGGASAGAGAAKAGAGAAGAAAAAAPVVLGAQVAKGAATAGPAVGAAIGSAAGQQLGAASTSSSRSPSPGPTPSSGAHRDVPTVLRGDA